MAIFSIELKPVDQVSERILSFERGPGG